MSKNCESATPPPSSDKCPHCHMPFNLLASPDLIPGHLSECSDFNRGHLTECFYGEKCDSNIESHFLRYNHNFDDTSAFLNSPQKRKSPNKTSPNKYFKVSPHRKKLKSDSSPKTLNIASESSKISPCQSSSITLTKTSPFSTSNISHHKSSRKKLNFKSPIKNPNSTVQISTITSSNETPTSKSIPIIIVESVSETVKSEPRSFQEVTDPPFCNLQKDLKPLKTEDCKVADGDIPSQSKNVIESNLHTLSSQDKWSSSSETKCLVKDIDVNKTSRIFLDKDMQKPSDTDTENEVKNVSPNHSTNHDKPNDKLSCSHYKSTLIDPKGSPNKPTMQTSITSYFSSLNSSHKVKSKEPSSVISPTLETFVPRQQKAKKSFVRNKESTNHVSGQKKGFKVRNKFKNKVVIESEPNAASQDSKRSCPFYKKIKNTAIAVDAFSYGTIPGIKYYFLSHFHSDHYQGLTKKFLHKVYCSKVTANLVELKIGLPSDQIKPLPLNEPIVMDNIIITLLDANHCPGSVMFLFELPDGSRYLHTGDFRACQEMEAHLPANQVDILYLDTTYCDPAYNFPSQHKVLSQVEMWVWEALSAHPKTLFVCGSYLIGKERLFMSIAEALDSKIWAALEKQRVLKNQENPFLSQRLVHDAHMAQIHVISMNNINRQYLQKHLDHFRPRYDHLVAFSPTGWTHKGTELSKIKPQRFGDVLIYGVPYSEHSSFEEMKKFVQYLRPAQIIPTVNVGSAPARKNMQEILQSWLQE